MAKKSRFFNENFLTKDENAFETVYPLGIVYVTVLIEFRLDAEEIRYVGFGKY